MNPAVECLQAQFERLVSRRGKAVNFGYVPGGRRWRGPSTIRPILELLSVMDAAPSMRVFPGDYADPEGVCL